MGRKTALYPVFTAVGQRFEIVDEKIENESPTEGHNAPYFYYHFNNGRPTLNVKDGRRALQQEDVDLEKSILSQRRDPEQYPEITYLAQAFASVKLYREWNFGRYTTPRMPQKADLPNDFLEPDACILGLVLNRLQRDPLVKGLLDALRSCMTELMTIMCKWKVERFRCFYMKVKANTRFRQHGFRTAPCGISAF